MIQHLCQNCIFKVEPQSIRDYYLKTLQSPCLAKWGTPEFKHLYWLCSNPKVAEVDHVEEHTIHKPCIEYNLFGNCTFYRQSDAEDIIPSSVSISYSKVTEEETQSDEEETFYVGDKVEIKVTVTPFSKPAVTESRQKLDIDGVPMVDDDGQPVMENVVIEPAFTNTQDISCKYQWYKNGRKLFQKRTDTIIVESEEPVVDEYYCEVTQYITNNGDGGNKEAIVKTDSVVIEFEEKEKDDTSTDNESTETEA